MTEKCIGQKVHFSTILSDIVLINDKIVGSSWLDEWFAQLFQHLWNKSIRHQYCL